MVVNASTWSSLTLVILCAFGLPGVTRARIASTATATYQNVKVPEQHHQTLDTEPAIPFSGSDASASINSSSISNGIGLPSAIWKDLALMLRVYQQCAHESLSVCLKVKLLAGLEKAGRVSRTLKLFEGVQFVSNEPESQDTSKGATTRLELSENEIIATLPRASDSKEHVLNSMIFKKVAGFLQDRTLQIKFPDMRQALNRATGSDLFESRGRKKDKKGNNGAYIMIPLLLGGTFIPVAYGALAMLSGKALIVSKLALVLASILGIKKLLGGEGKEPQHEVVVQSGSHSGWGREMDLAYNGWKPAREPAKLL